MRIIDNIVFALLSFKEKERMRQLMNEISKSESYAAAGVDITAGYKAVELMKSILPRP